MLEYCSSWENMIALDHVIASFSFRMPPKERPLFQHPCSIGTRPECSDSESPKIATDITQIVSYCCRFFP